VRPHAGSASNPVDFSTGGKKGDSLISKIPVTLSLDLSGGLTSQIWSGKLNWKLTGKPITITIPKDTTIAGLPVAGTLTFDPKAGGTVQGAVATVLPAVLGGGKANLAFTSVYGKGITELKVTATKAALGTVFSVTQPSLTYTKGTWTIKGRIGTAKGPLDLDGNLVYDSKGVLTSGRFLASNVALARFWKLKTFLVTYDKAKGTWQVTANTGASGGTTFQGTFMYNKQGVLTSGVLKASRLSLGNTFTMRNVALTYGAGPVWTASGQWGNVDKPSQFQGQLRYDKLGNLTQGSLSVTNVALADLYVAKVASFTFKASGTGASWSLAVSVVGADGNTVSLKGAMNYDAAGTLTSGEFSGTGLTLGGLFKLADVNFKYEFSVTGDTWSMTANATGSTGAQHALKGSIGFDTVGAVSSGDLSVEGLTLAGIITLKTFSLHFDQKQGWMGSADLEQGSQSAQVMLAFTPDGQLISGSLHATGVKLFGVLDLKTFNLDYTAKKGWDLSVVTTLKNGSPVTVTLKVVNGAVTGASLGLTNVSFAGKLTIDSLYLKYESVQGNVTFSGGAKVTLPGPASKTIDGSFTFYNGLFEKGSLELKGLNVPLGYGIFLDKLSAAIEVQHNQDGSIDPVSVKGGVGLTAGPKTAAGSAMAVDGTLEYDWPVIPRLERWDITGGVDVANIRLGNGEIVVSGGQTTLTITLGAGDGSEGLHLGKLATLHGNLSGTFTSDTLDAAGHADFTIGGYTVNGDVAYNANGLAACGSLKGKSGLYGFNWTWGQYPSPKFGNCSLDGF
jgi:hypothetical protein